MCFVCVCLGGFVVVFCYFFFHSFTYPIRISEFEEDDKCITGEKGQQILEIYFDSHHEIRVCSENIQK